MISVASRATGTVRQLASGAATRTFKWRRVGVILGALTLSGLALAAKVTPENHKNSGREEGWKQSNENVYLFLTTLQLRWFGWFPQIVKILNIS